MSCASMTANRIPRAWEGKPKIAVQAYLAAFAIFEVYVTLFGTMLDEVAGSRRSSAGC